MTPRSQVLDEPKEILAKGGMFFQEPPDLDEPSLSRIARGDLSLASPVLEQVRHRSVESDGNLL